MGGGKCIHHRMRNFTSPTFQLLCNTPSHHSTSRLLPKHSPSAQKPKGGGGKGRSTTSSVYRKLPSTSTASPPYRASSNFVISLPSQSLTVASSASLPPASPPTSPHALQDPFPPPRLTIEQELPQKEEEQEEEIRYHPLTILLLFK